jgi:hypothetical protein
MAKRPIGPPSLDDLKRQRANLLARAARHAKRIERLAIERQSFLRIAGEIASRMLSNAR